MFPGLGSEKGSPCAGENDEVRSEQQKRNSQISSPAFAERDSKRNANDKTNHVSDVSDVRIITGYPALLCDHDHVVEEVNNRYQSLWREEQPGKLERAH